MRLSVRLCLCVHSFVPLHSSRCLTEPQCGSDLSQVATRATPLADGSFHISGTKIFISCGEHDLTNNIIHCVLARVPDAPPGIQGLSLFVVPKLLVGDDGALEAGASQVKIGRIEDKLGCHGSPTCVFPFLVFPPLTIALSCPQTPLLLARSLRSSASLRSARLQTACGDAQV